MEDTKTAARTWPVWVDWEKRVISFRPEPDFVRLDWPDYEKMLRFAVEKGKEGFALQ